MGFGLKKIKKGLKKAFKKVGSVVNDVEDAVAGAVPKPLKGVAKFGARMFLFGPALLAGGSALSAYGRGGGFADAFKKVLGDQAKLGATGAAGYLGSLALPTAATAGVGGTTGTLGTEIALGGATPLTTGVTGVGGGTLSGLGTLATSAAPEIATGGLGGLGTSAAILGGSQVLSGIAGGLAQQQAAKDARKAEDRVRKQDNRWGVNNFSGEVTSPMVAPIFRGPVVPTVTIPPPVTPPNIRGLIGRTIGY